MIDSRTIQVLPTDFFYIYFIPSTSLKLLGVFLTNYKIIISKNRRSEKLLGKIKVRSSSKVSDYKLPPRVATSLSPKGSIKRLTFNILKKLNGMTAIFGNHII